MAVCAVVAVWAAQARAEQPEEIRIVTYNIHHGEGLDGKTDLPRIAMVLLAEKPDIVALQAVDQKTGRSEGVDQAEAIGKLIGMQAYFSRTMDFDGGAFGNAVLTNLPVRSQDTVKLESFRNVSPQRAEQRALQVLELGEKGGPGLWFMATVLDYRQDRDGNDERSTAARTINDLIALRGDEPAILAGTMNAAPKNLSIRVFAKQWKIAGINRDGTGPEAEGIGDAKKLRLIHSYPAPRPRYPLNYVMCRPADQWQVVEVRVLDEAASSTHRPVLAVLRRVEEDKKTK